MFVRSYNPIWYLVDLTGLGLNDTYYLFIKQNTIPYAPYNPPAVFQDPNGVTPWSIPIQFFPNGTLPDNIYFNPGLVYRLEIRQGNTQNAPLIYLVENYVPSTGSGTITNNFFNNSQNLITNPQFADVYFNSSATVTVAGSYFVAPGWQLVLTGSGSTTLTQVALPGSNNLPGNPPFALEVSNTGWTTASLVQTFNNNGAIFSGGSIALSMLAKTTTNPFNASLTYSQNSSTPLNVTFTGTTTAGVYTSIGGGSNVSISTNANSGSAAIVTITIPLPVNDAFFVTDVQFIGQEVPLAASPLAIGAIPSFQEISYERMVDQEFHVYRTSILNQPKDSMLTAWNFGNNPWQFSPPGGTNLAANQYTADQTIVIQQNYVATATGTNVNAAQASFTNDHGFEVTAITVHNEFAILQYVAPQTMMNFWGKNVSCMVNAFLSSVHAPFVGVQFKMRLMYHANTPNTISQTDPIASWAENGDPVAAAGYTMIVPPYDPIYTLTSTPQNYQFNAIPLPTLGSTTNTLGVLIYTISNMNSTATADFIVFKDVSLCQNDFALSTQPETYDQTLAKCQYYFETSYDSFAAIGTVTGNSQLNFEQVNSAGVMYPSTFTIQFKNVKRVSPTMVIYSPTTGATGNVGATSLSSSTAVYSDVTSADYAITNYQSSGGLSTASYQTIGGASHPAAGPNTTHNNAPLAAYIGVHYYADARLGVIP